MGYAIIKDLAGNKNYALNRLIQNLIPKDSSMRVYIEDAEGTKSFSYGEGANGIYKLASVNLGNATLPYEYVLALAKTGVSVNSISGVITVTSDLASETSVTVNLIPVFNTYYPVTGHNASYKLSKTVLVAPPELDSPATDQDYYDVVIRLFTYSEAPANGGQATPSVTYEIYKNHVHQTELTATSIVYEVTDESLSPIGASTDSNFSTNGIIQFSANSGTLTRSFTHIKVTVSYRNVSVDADASSYAFANATQAGAGTPSEDVYSELSYDTDFVLPTFIRMNGYTGEITLPEGLSQTLNGNPVDTTNAYYDYKIGNNGNYLALDTTTRTINVGINETNAPQDVSITVRVSLNNKEHTATTTLTNYPLETVNGNTNSYLDGYTKLTINKTNDYKGSISNNATPTLSSNGYHTKAFEGAAGNLKVIAYHSLSYSTHVGLLSTTLQTGEVETISGNTSSHYTALKKEGANSRTGLIIEFGTVNASTNYSIGVRDDSETAINVYYKIE